MSIGKPARLAATFAALFVSVAPPVLAQSGEGDGFLFRPPRATLTLHGGFATPLADGGVFSLARRELTLGRGDFDAGSLGGDFAIAIRPQTELVFGFETSRSLAASEYREWVDNNDQPIEQETRLQRTPFIASVRHYFGPRGRRIGSVAWIPAQFVPFVSVGGGVVRYRFQQSGDFVDEQTLNVFTSTMTSRGWARAFQGAAGAQWSLNHRFTLTGEARYLYATGDGDTPNGDFSGYKVNLSGVNTLIGLTLRF